MQLLECSIVCMTLWLSRLFCEMSTHDVSEFVCLPGVNHNELVQHAEASFSGIPEGMTTTDSPSEYVGGN